MSDHHSRVVGQDGYVAAASLHGLMSAGEKWAKRELAAASILHKGHAIAYTAEVRQGCTVTPECVTVVTRYSAIEIFDRDMIAEWIESQQAAAEAGEEAQQ